MDEKNNSSLKKFSYKETLEEAERLRDLLLRYKKRDPFLLADFDYRKTLYAFRYYRHRLSSWKKSERNT